MQGGAGAQHELAAASRTFFDSMRVSGGLSLFATNLPVALRPFICRLSYHLSAHSAPLNRALDVIFAATQQMVEAYAAAHPELEVEARPDAEILQRGLGQKVLEEGAVPSEHSLIAHMLRCHNKCAAGLLSRPVGARATSRGRRCGISSCSSHAAPRAASHTPCHVFFVQPGLVPASSSNVPCFVR